MIISDKKLKKCAAWIAAWIVVTGLAAGACIPAKAAAEDTDQEGSITIELEDIGTDVSEVEFSCYLVAEPADGGGTFWKLLPAFESAGVDVNQLKNAGDYREAAEKLAASEGKSGAVCLHGKTDTEGTVSFQALKQGIYLVELTDGKHYGAVAPVLISVPGTLDGQEWIWNIHADTKGERISERKGSKDGGSEEGSQVSNGFPVQTGDPARPGVYAVLAAAAVLGIIKVIRKKERK